MQSQKGRLESLLQKNGYWDGTQLIIQEKDVQDMSDEEQKELAQASDIVDYLTR